MAQDDLLLDSITNEKTVELIQLDTTSNTTYTRHPTLAGSNNYGEYTHLL